MTTRLMRTGSLTADVGRRLRLGPPLVWAALAVIALGALAYTSALTPTMTSTITRPHSVAYTFDYRSSGRADSEVYGPGGLEFGDTIFLALVDRLAVDVTFDARSPDAVVESADLEVVGRVSSSSGWTSDVVAPVVGTTIGEVARATVMIDFDEIASVIDRYEDLTATTGSYSLAVVAAGSTSALVDPPGVPVVDDRSTATIEFAITPTTATLVSPPRSLGPGRTDVGPNRSRIALASGATRRDDSGRDAGVDPSVADPSMADPSVADPAGADPSVDGVGDRPSAGVDPRLQVVTRMVTAESVRPRTISLGLVDTELGPTRRVLAATAGLAALLTTLSATVALVRRHRRSETDRLLDRHRRRLLPLTSWNENLERYALEVGDFSALEAISTTTEQPILYATQAAVDGTSSDGHRSDTGAMTRFVVIDGSNVYVYRPDAPLVAAT